jgi:hypothetical protein
MCETPRPLPPREVVPHVHDDNVIPTVGGDEQSFTFEFRGIDNDDDQFNIDAAIAASLDSGNVNALGGHCVKRGCRNVPHFNGLCVDCLILEYDAQREELVVANQKINSLQKELGAAVCLTEMGSSTVFHHTDNNNNKRDSSLNISDDRSNRKAVKDGEEEFYLDDDLSSILNVTGMSADGKTDVLSQLVADYDNTHHKVDIPISTPFLAPRGDVSVPNDTGTATSPLLNTRLFSTTTTTKEKKKKKKKKKKTTKKKEKNDDCNNLIDRYHLKEATEEEKKEMLEHGKFVYVSTFNMLFHSYLLISFQLF